MFLTLHDHTWTTRFHGSCFFCAFFFALVSNAVEIMIFCAVLRLSKCRSNHESHKMKPNVLISALNVKVNEIQTSAKRTVVTAMTL